MLSAGRCSELRDVGKPERLLNLSDLRYGIVESVFAEGSMFDVFELVAHLAKLPFREGILPGGKDDRFLASRVVLIHRDERLECPGKGFGVAAADRAFPSHLQDIVGDFAASIMLGFEHIDITRRRAAGLFTTGKI